MSRYLLKFICGYAYELLFRVWQKYQRVGLSFIIIWFLLIHIHNYYWCLLNRVYKLSLTDKSIKFQYSSVILKTVRKVSSSVYCVLFLSSWHPDLPFPYFFHPPIHHTLEFSIFVSNFLRICWAKSHSFYIPNENQQK